MYTHNAFNSFNITNVELNLVYKKLVLSFSFNFNLKKVHFNHGIYLIIDAMMDCSEKGKHW